MKLDANDRSRLVFASLLTAVALPAIWWANEDDAATTRPNVAAAGLAAEDPAPDAEPETVPAPVEPAYLIPASTVAGQVDAEPPRVQVGPVDDALVAVAVGTYRRSVGQGRCEVTGVGVDGTITVFNPANGQAIDCRVVRGDADEPTVVLSLADFDDIADFAEAPISVEIRE